MALSDPTDTLAYQRSRILTTARPMADVPLSAVTTQIVQFLATAQPPRACPENEALWFYGMNHGVSLIAGARAPLEPLPEDERTFVEAYHRLLGPKAVRAFYYLLLICTRESRHNKSLGKDAKKIAKLFGPAVADFHTSIKGGESSIHQALLEKPPAATLGQYVGSLAWVFYNSSWLGGYGGKKWGVVADCLYRFVHGETSAEMMLDAVWALAHNNGPIFNKGLAYSGYSPTLISILDVQRAGQIPTGVLTEDDFEPYVEPDLQSHMQWLQGRFALPAYVDWYVVEALGSVKKYPAAKKAQLVAHGASPFAAEAEQKAAAAALAQALAEAKKAAAHGKKWFLVSPGLELKKINIKREVAA